MGSFEFVGVSSPAELANRAAADWLSLIRSHSGEEPFGVALLGGRIAPLLFDAFVTRIKSAGVEIRSVHFFWGDERCVPPSSPDSNFAIAQKHLLDPLRIPAHQIHRIRAEESNVSAAAEAETDLRALLKTLAPAVPAIHLVLLGMGEDGHVASLFPGETDELLRDSRVYRLVRGAKPPPLRVTLGYAPIAAAHEVWVLASGAGKEEVLHKSLVDRSTPLGRLVNLRPNTRVYSDLHPDLQSS